MGMLQSIPQNLHRVTVEGDPLWFHIPTTSLFAPDAVSEQLLDLLNSEVGGLDAATLHHRFVGQLSRDDLQERIDQLKALKLITEGEVQAYNPRVEVEQFPLSTVVLNVNTGCNLSCSYCYKEDLDNPRDGKKMNLATAQASVEMMLAEAPQRDRYNIVFFGGEPLSNMPLIREVVAWAEERIHGLGKQVDFTLTTNATLLSEDKIAYFQAHRFGLTVSMDGPKAVHDKNRIAVNGQGTYDLVARRIAPLLANYTARPVGSRVTLTRGVTDVEGIHHHLVNELGFAEAGFAPVTSGDMAEYNLTGDELKAVFNGMVRLGERAVEAAIEGRDIGFGNFNQLLTDLWEGRSKAVPCGAGLGLVSVDHEGDVHLCHRFTGSDMPTFGNVNDGLDHQGLKQFVEARSDRTDRGCSDCRIRNLCSGGCYHESYARYGDPMTPTYHYCDLMRDWVDFGIQAYARILRHNPAYFDGPLAGRQTA
ncbi:quinohemoprotein amine dehydrogenase maturation protein [Billgrantia saliphila]|uniref:quinohemoprotein amine dehydrogenase maturation protein n=1 Tax=Billgrantia saliphila TaxID=1848458 RepID=UPI000CE448A8|nr:quinohemoprotein amine dehydrogenase maturation protein [Halomonas saliphila]